MAEKVLVNCSTGESTRHQLPAEEEMHLSQTAASWTQRQADHREKQSQRETVITRLAKAAGVSVDELKHAFNLSFDVPASSGSESSATDGHGKG